MSEAAWVSHAASNLARVAQHARKVGHDETVEPDENVEITHTILGKVGDAYETASLMKPPVALAGVRRTGAGRALGSGRDERAMNACDERAMRSRRVLSSVPRGRACVSTQAGGWGTDATLAHCRGLRRDGGCRIARSRVCVSMRSQCHIHLDAVAGPEWPSVAV